MNLKNYLATFLVAAAMIGCTQEKKESVLVSNPILPGYFADPSVVESNGKYYIYATIDPWGGDSLSCWVTEDFVNWEFEQLNWPTKQACTSPKSQGAKVWAPSVIQKGDKYYMYISVGSEVYAGVADSPLGPWKNVYDDNRPFLEYDETGYCHVIDAEVFIDDDGRNYLYWGSGWNWTNGRCYVAELADDMTTFITEKKEVTPTNYFEAPFMIRKGDTYYLTYSDGITIEDSYKVRYATSKSPFGPFVEADNSPILEKDPSRQVYGPGHHTLTNIQGELYILYHKHRLPFIEGSAYRQMCIDKFTFSEEEGKINNITPTDGIEIAGLTKKAERGTIKNITAEATSVKDQYSAAANVLDNSFQTMWVSAAGDNNSSLKLTLDKKQDVKQISILFEYAWEKYPFTCFVSADGENWETVCENSNENRVGSPMNISINKNIQYIKFDFNKEAAIWSVYVD